MGFETKSIETMSVRTHTYTDIDIYNYFAPEKIHKAWCPDNFMLVSITKLIDQGTKIGFEVAFEEAATAQEMYGAWFTMPDPFDKDIDVKVFKDTAGDVDPLHGHLITLTPWHGFRWLRIVPHDDKANFTMSIIEFYNASRIIRVA